MNVTEARTGIPEEMRRRPQWVVFRIEMVKDAQGNEKPTKVPYCSSRPYRHASTTDPSTWFSYEGAVRSLERAELKLNGIGYVFSRDDPYCGIDLDHCIENGEPNEFAQAMIDRLDSYTEYSFSGDGIHIIVAGTPPRGRKKANIEVYGTERYFVMTGKHLAGTRRHIMPRQDVLDELFDTVLYEERTAPAELDWQRPDARSDADVLKLVSTSQQAGKFRRLYNHGDTMGYGSGSEGDLALCSILAFWTDNNPAQIDRLFRESNLFRPKWDEKHGAQTYGEMTIAKAISGTTETYSGQGKSVSTDSTWGRNVAEQRLELQTEGKAFFVWPKDLDKLPETEWLVEDFMEKDALGVIAGKPGSAKSFVMLDLACCIATGKHWHGRDVVQGTVVYVYAEGLRGLHQRLLAWEDLNRRTVERVAFVPRAIQMLQPEDVDFLIERIAAELDEPPIAIFIDTLARAMVGGDENDQKDMGLVIEAADHLRRETEAAVWFVHHFNKEGRLRGSTSLDGGVSTFINTEKKGDIVTLECAKQKDGEQGWTVELIAENHLASIALRHVDDAILTAKKQAAVSKNALQTLATLPEKGARYMEWFAVSGQKHKGTFDRHRKQLVEAGMVEEKDGLWTLAVSGLTRSHSGLTETGSAVSSEGPPSVRGGPGETTASEPVSRWVDSLGKPLPRMVPEP